MSKIHGGGLRLNRQFAFILLSFLLVFACLTVVRAQIGDGAVDAGFNAAVTEGTGYVDESLVQPDGKIIVAGVFHRVNGTKSSGIAQLNADGTLDTSFNAGGGANSSIRSLALQADGKILVGGLFTNFNNQTARRIVRLNADGSLDSSFNPSVNINNQINDILVLPDGKILLGGAFTFTNNRLALFNSDGTFVNAVSGFNNTVNKLLMQPDGKILVGTTAASPAGIRRLNADLTEDSGFNPGTGPNSQVDDIALQPDGKIVLSGGFWTFNGTSTDGIVRLNGNGSFDTAFDFVSDQLSTNQEVLAVALQPDGKILASTYQPTENGITSLIRRFNANGTLDGTFSTGDLGPSIALSLNALGDGSFFVSGSFVTYNNQTRLHFTKRSPNGEVDAAFNAAVSVTATVRQIKSQADGKILIAGDFNLVNGVPRGGLARLNTDGSLDGSFNQGRGFDGTVFSFAVQPDGKIVAGGFYSFYNGNLASNLARLNADGSFDLNLYTDFSTYILSVVNAVAVQPDGKILVGGNMLRFSPTGVPSAIRVNPNGELDASFNAPIVGSGFTTLLAYQSSGKVVAAGTFSSNSTNFPRGGVARLNGDGSLDTTGWFGSGCCYTALNQRPDGTIYLAFTNVSKFSEDGALISNFTGFNNSVQALEVLPDGKLLVAGLFDSFNSIPVKHILRVNANGSIDQTFDRTRGTTGDIYALNVQADGKLLVGGKFLDYNGVEKFSIVRLNNGSRKAPYDFDGDGKTDIGIFRPSDGSWWYTRSSSNDFRVYSFGVGTDMLTPGDWTGDGKADISVFRPGTNEFFIQRSEDNSYFSFPFASPGDIPAPADYDADGKTDAAVFNPSQGTWYILNSGGSGVSIVPFGTAGDRPVPADYDGDGKADIAIFRPSDGSWWYIRSSDAAYRVFAFGVGTDKPVEGDWTGDGKADIAVFRPSTGEWFFQRSEDNSYYSVPFGLNGDIPAPGDYDGDGRFDTAVFRPSDATWYINRSTAGILITTFGANGDRPIPNAFVP